MKWVLIMISIAGWDGTYEKHNELGQFEKLTDCTAERDRLTIQNHGSTQWACVQKPLSDSKGGES